MSKIICPFPFLVHKIWGGDRLANLKKITFSNNNPLGEAWEVSLLKEGQSSVAGVPLGDIVSKKQLPYLIKFIDTSANLSIQVHPDDAFAKAYENSFGKTECWIILEARPGAGIYLGLSEEVTKEKFKKALKDKEDISRLLRFYPVSTGDFVLVPAGGIHAIGGGVLLLEIQQSSGITYRIWDWDRVDAQGNPRKLHVDKAMKVICFEDKFNKKENFHFQEKVLQKSHEKLICHPQFEVHTFVLSAGEKTILTSMPDRFASLVCLSGSMSVEREKAEAYQSLLIRPGEKVEVVAQKKGVFAWIR